VLARASRSESSLRASAFRRSIALDLASASLRRSSSSEARRCSSMRPRAERYCSRSCRSGADWAAYFVTDLALLRTPQFGQQLIQNKESPLETPSNRTSAYPPCATVVVTLFDGACDRD
jgi:hypothetical protein